MGKRADCVVYEYTCQDGHDETHAVSVEEAADLICEWRYRAEKSEAEVAQLRMESAEAFVEYVIARLPRYAVRPEEYRTVLEEFRVALAAKETR